MPNNITESATITQTNGRHQARSDQNPHANATNPTIAISQSTPRTRTNIPFNPNRSVNILEVIEYPGDFIRPLLWILLLIGGQTR
ncbi:MAG: hypothetical protein ACE5R6_20975 [Candidatus Heimdallarchaeota archaeon]